MGEARSPGLPRGFGLLEAIVGLAIFAGAGMALFGWINANLERAGRLAEREAEARALSLAVEWADVIDPARQAEGRVELDAGTRIAWAARPLTPRQSVAPLPGGTQTPFEVGLFEVEVTVSVAGLPGPRAWRLRRLGVWREPYMLPQ